MKLCVVFGLDLDPPGGAERLVLEEVAYFARAGFEVTLAVPDLDAEYVADVDLPEGVSVVAFGDPRFGLRGVRRVRNVLRAAEPDLVFAHYIEEVVYPALRTLAANPPVVCHVHGSPFWFPDNPRLLPHRRSAGFDALLDAVRGHREFNGDGGDIPLRKRAHAEVWELVRTRAYRAAEVVFTGSERVQEELDGLYDVDPVVVRPGVSQEWLETAANDPPRRLIDCEHVLLTASRLDSRKRIDIQIDALARLRARGLDAGLVVCGTGPDERRLRQRVAHHDLGGAVRFAGYVPETDLPAYYRSATAFACSAWMSYGLAPLEAYAAGTKVALATDTYVKELLREHSGVVVAAPEPEPWADALESLLDAAPPADPHAVPTWRSFCQRKHEVLAAQGLV